MPPPIRRSSPAGHHPGAGCAAGLSHGAGCQPVQGRLRRRQDPAERRLQDRKAACATLAANAKDICVEEAKAHEKVGRADLEFGLSSKQRDYTKLQQVKAATAYTVARERCDDKSGNDKDICIKEAKAIKSKAMAAAKHDKIMVDASKDEMAARQTADYKVAAEKCDALAGDAKTSCMTAAKQKYNQS